MSDITPIFVVGGARNGTTWLGNLLGLHPDIASVHHPIHHGNHEANILRCHRYYGNFPKTDDYIRFVHHYATEDFFKIIGRKPEDFLHDNHATNFFEFFLDLMDEFARTEGKSHWCSKLDPLFTIEPAVFAQFTKILNARYAKVKWVGIQRDGIEAMNSYLFMEGANNQRRTRAGTRVFSLLLGTARYSAQYAFFNDLMNRVSGFRIRFEEMKKEKANVSNLLDTYLGLQNSLAVGIPARYKKNTSFKGKQEGQSLSSFERKFASVLLKVFGLFPFLGRLIYAGYENKIKGIKDPSYHRLLKARHFPESFAAELARIGAVDISEQLHSE